MNSLEELQDRLAIREVAELYSVSVTQRDWDSMAGCFLLEARWHTSFGHDFRTRQGIRDGIRGLIEGFEFLVQMSHSVVIGELMPARAKATVVVNEFGRNVGGQGGIFVLGLYHDTLVKAGGRWLFEDREFRAHYMDTAPPPGHVLVNTVSPAR